MIDDPVRPTAIRLEASSHCQLRCPSCPTTVGAIHPAIGSGFLRAADFERFLERNPEVREIELSNYGEIFLNPELSEILRLGHERGVRLAAWNGVNLNTVRGSVLEDLVRYRLHVLTCSIDGVTQKTYERYRVRGSLAAVLDNIRTLNALKRRHGSPYPILRWQFVVFGHNEHEIPAARRLAGELKMDFSPKLNWDAGFSPIRDHELVRRETGLAAASREDHRREIGEDYAHGLCHQLWASPQVNWDGKLLGCGRNFWRDYPVNAFQLGLFEAVNSEPLRYARAMLTGKVPARDDIPCASCEIYLDMRETRRWIGSARRSGLGRAETLARAAAYLALGRLFDAEQLYLSVLSRDASEPAALQGMASIRRRLGFDDAPQPVLEPASP